MKFTLAFIAGASGLELRHHLNPIRKVVNLLQKMEQKVQAEGEKEKELHEKYLCYCTNGASALEKSIDEYGDRMPTLEAGIKEGNEKLITLKQDLRQHKKDRADAKEAVAEAQGVREKDNKAFKAEAAEYQADMSAMKKAMKALMGGQSGSFLQTSAAQTLQRLVQAKEDMNDGDRQELVSFLSDEDGAPVATMEIVGILKQMISESEKNLGDITATEKSALASHDELVKAKTKEIDVHTKQIEIKLSRVGEIAVEVVAMKDDLGEAGVAIVEDKKFLADLDRNCDKQQKLYEENAKMRQQEVLAIADTIKILNDDDALELFKKTLPGSASFLQLQVTTEELRARALNIINAARRKGNRREVLDFIALAMNGRQMGFDKIIKMVDNLIVELKKEQVADDEKKTYCAAQFEESDGKRKALVREISDQETNMADAKEAIAALAQEIDSLADGIRSLDKQVAEGTEQRKEEASDYNALIASNSAAKQLLEFAKNRLNKFYNPKMYKPEAKPGDELALFLQKGAPPPPPETVKAFSKKSGASSGVIQMIDLLIKDIVKETAEAETIEKNAQEDYEQMLADAAAKRAEDAKSLTDKEAVRTDLQQSLQEYGAAHKVASKMLMATEKYISNLHGECDFLLKYFDVRKEARSGEIDALNQCKAVLSGADNE